MALSSKSELYLAAAKRTNKTLTVKLNDFRTDHYVVFTKGDPLLRIIICDRRLFTKLKKLSNTV